MGREEGAHRKDVLHGVALLERILHGRDADRFKLARVAAARASLSAARVRARGTLLVAARLDHEACVRVALFAFCSIGRRMRHRPVARSHIAHLAVCLAVGLIIV